ncbi:hypothetical protein K449DRAFT_403988 [Hypoxylon sp. EC38]|nr:hypothetical protein K449DRAFT_403988 [Hypoxylon sp. EC38]
MQSRASVFRAHYQSTYVYLQLESVADLKRPQVVDNPNSLARYTIYQSPRRFDTVAAFSLLPNAGICYYIVEYWPYAIEQAKCLLSRQEMTSPSHTGVCLSSSLWDLVHAIAFFSSSPFSKASRRQPPFIDANDIPSKSKITIYGVVIFLSTVFIRWKYFSEAELLTYLPLTANFGIFFTELMIQVGKGSQAQTTLCDNVRRGVGFIFPVIRWVLRCPIAILGIDTSTGDIENHELAAGTLSSAIDNTLSTTGGASPRRLPGTQLTGPA